MTRLINADEIKYQMLFKEDFLKGTGTEEQAVWKKEIDRMPTVEAVPVDFIEKEAEKMKNSENPAMRINSVILSALIRDWREQQSETV